MKKTYGKYPVAHKSFECLYCHTTINTGEPYKYSNGRKYHRLCWERNAPTGYEKLIALLESEGPLFSDEISKEYSASTSYRMARIHGLPVQKIQWTKGNGSGDRSKSRRFLLFYLDKDKKKALRRIKERGHSSKGKTFARPILGNE